MAQYRCTGSKILFGDQLFSRATGPFELDDKTARTLLEAGKIVPVNAPILPGIAEETVKVLEGEVKSLRKQLSDKDNKILELSALLDKKEADIDMLNKTTNKK